MIILAMPSSAEIQLPDRISRAFSESSQNVEKTVDLSVRDEEFVRYIMNNWREIARDIEVIPSIKDPYMTQTDARSAPVIRFSEICQKLPPMEYVDFLDQMLLLYEQKRISDKAFARIILPELEKRSFLSVNYEHSRVADILKKAIRLTPAKNEPLKSCLEDMVSGKLADNYMADRSDDDPKPETLPGIKLKRPWGSLIRKYERVTGKKLPPDPDFPEEDPARPERRPGQKDPGSMEEVVELTPLGKSLLGGILALVAAGIAWGIARWRRKRGK